MSPKTLDRLKSLPLTIILTVLIWMYAEAKFTATGDARLTLRPISPNGDLTVRVFDPGENRFQPTINIEVTLQGPTNQIETVQQQADMPPLTFSPDAAKLKIGTENRVDAVAMLNSLSSFRKQGLTVLAANPSRLRLEVDRLEQLTKPVEFHPTIDIEGASMTPPQATILIPSQVLAAIGGRDKVTVAAVPGRELATLPIGIPQTVAVDYVAQYPGPRDDRISVDPPQGTMTLTLRQAITLTASDVPVWVSGPPSLLARYDVDIQPKTVRVTVSGSETAIRALQEHMMPGHAAPDGIHAYLDISPDDRPAEGYLHRRVRYVMPEGLVAQEAPADVMFRLIEKSARETQPAGTR